MEKFFSHVFTDRLTVFSGIRAGSLETTSIKTSGILLDSYNYWYPNSGLYTTSIVTTLLNSISGIFSTITANNVSLNNNISLNGNIYLPYTRCPSPSGIIYKNGVPFIHDYCAECDEVGINLYCNNLFIGENAGNFTMGLTATVPKHSSNNIGIGYKALHSNTLGSSNIAVGNEALKNSTTGDGNIAIGRGVLFRSTDAGYNVVIGSNAGGGGAFGNYNVAIGRSTLYCLDEGDNNVALGAYAGYWASDGITQITTVNQSVLLGYKAKPYANGDTNEIVIGYDAAGHGSNTVTLGNENITQTILRGSIGIGGITNPSYSLEVSGISKFWSNVHVPYPVEDTHAVNKEYVDLATAAATWDFFLSDDSADITGYYYLYENESGTSTTTLTSPSLSTGDDQLLWSFVTESGLPNIDNLSIGVYSAVLFLQKSGNKTVNIYWKLFKREQDGTETELMTSEISSDLSANIKQYILSSSENEDIPLDQTDRLVLKIYANVSGNGNDPQVTITMEGEYDSRIALRVESSAFSNVFVQKSGDTMYGTLHMNADILPSGTVTRSLGSSSLKWKDIYTSNINTETINDFITIDLNSNQVIIGDGNSKVIEKLIINGSLGLRDGVLWQPVYPSDDGLILYFPFSEGKGMKVHDKSPNGNDGEIHGAVWTNGKFGKALYFDGNDSYIKTNEDGPSGIYTISYGCWIKTSQNGQNKHILNIGEPVTNGMVHMMLYDGKIKYGAWGFDCFSERTYNDGNWHYVVVVYDKENFKLYVDGTLESFSSDYASLNLVASPIYIGKYCEGDGFGFNGIIDEVRIYNRALNEEEIKMHYLYGLQSHGYITANNFKIINTSAQELVRVTFSDEGSMVGIGTDDPSATLDVSGIIKGTNLELVSGIIYPSADSTTAIQINKADGTTNIVNIDTTNRRVGIGVTSPNAKLEVAGRIYQSGLGYSTFIGYEAGKNDDLSSNTNTAVGYQSMYSNTSGYKNTSIGTYSLYSNTAGYFNVAVGVRALYSNTTGTDNIAIGNSTLRLNETGSFNIAIGRDALYNNTSNNNIAIGFTALRSNTTGSNNTVIGYAAGYNSTGNSNVFIGHKAGYNETGSNKLYIANSDTSNPLIYGEFDNNKVKINKHLVVNEDLKLECVTTLPTASSEQEGKLIYHCWSETIGKDILYHRDLVFCVKTGTSSYTWETIVNKSWTESA